MDDDALGSAFVDAFRTVPPGHHEAYARRLHKVCQQLGVDLVVPTTDWEVETLARPENQEIFDCPILVDELDIVQCAFNKATAYTKMKEAGVPVPYFEVPRTRPELMGALDRMGWSDRFVVIRTSKGSGSTGIWFVTKEIYDRSILRYEDHMMDARSLPRICAAVSRDDTLMAVEVLGGPLYTVSMYCEDGEAKVVVPLLKHQGYDHMGSTHFVEVDLDEKVMAVSRQVAECFGFNGLVNIDLAYNTDGRTEMPKVHDVNPRVSTDMCFHSNMGFDLLSEVVLRALGRPTFESWDRIQRKVEKAAGLRLARGYVSFEI
jgi:predicted ATP-grasp superfamily ATP-dependent carboligase